MPGGTGLSLSSFFACCTAWKTLKGAPGTTLPNCWMMALLPVVVSPIGCHRQGGGGTGSWAWTAPLPTSPLSVIRLFSETEQVLPVQPTNAPALAGPASPSVGQSGQAESNEAT